MRVVTLLTLLLLFGALVGPAGQVAAQDNVPPAAAPALPAPQPAPAANAAPQPAAPDNAPPAGIPDNAAPPPSVAPMDPRVAAIQALYAEVRRALLAADGAAFWATLAAAGRKKYEAALGARRDLIAKFPAEFRKRIDPALGVPEADLLTMTPQAVIAAQLKHLPEAVRERLTRATTIIVVESEQYPKAGDVACFRIVGDTQEDHLAVREGGAWKYLP